MPAHEFNVVPWMCWAAMPTSYLYSLAKTGKIDRSRFKVARYFNTCIGRKKNAFDIELLELLKDKGLASPGLACEKN